MSSLRRRLLFILVGSFMLVWLVAFIATYAAATRRIEVLFDAELAHEAGVLLTLAETGLHERREPTGASRKIPLDTARFRKVLAFTVWRGKQAVLHSENAPVLDAPANAGYANLAFKGRDWRGYTLHGADGLIVWVGEPFSLRARLVNEIARDELFPLLLGIPLLAALAWWGVGRGLLPLDRVASEVAQRSPRNLRPVDSQQVPAEIKVLVAKLNALLAHLHEAFEGERRFTSDAAHEMRTPLAGIKTHMQVALRTTNEVQRRHEMERVIQDVDRTTHLVEQLLTLSRLDREPPADERAIVDLRALAAEVLAALGQDAAAKDIALIRQEGGPAEVRGHAVMLGAMIRNLVDNAIRYTPAGGRVELAVASEGDRVVLTVTDNGPGIPVDERARVFDRFYRGSTAGAQGCGLGLSIVLRVAELHRAVVVLVDAPAGQGLQARVIFAGELS